MCQGMQSRKYLTKDERIAMLREYKEALDKESQGVSEAIARLEATAQQA